MIAKKADFVELLQGMFLVKDLKGKNFSLTISKNMKLIQNSIKDLEHQGMPSEEFVELASKIRELAKDTSEEGKLKIEKLEQENEAIITERKNQIADIKEKLQEEIELELLTIDEDSLPEDISTEQLVAIEKLMK